MTRLFSSNSSKKKRFIIITFIVFFCALTLCVYLLYPHKIIRAETSEKQEKKDNEDSPYMFYKDYTSEKWLEVIYGKRGIKELGVELINGSKYQIGTCNYNRMTVFEKKTSKIRYYVDNYLVPQYPKSWHRNSDIYGPEHKEKWELVAESVRIINDWSEENDVVYGVIHGSLIGYCYSGKPLPCKCFYNVNFSGDDDIDIYITTDGGLNRTLGTKIFLGKEKKLEFHKKPSKWQANIKMDLGKKFHSGCVFPCSKRDCSKKRALCDGYKFYPNLTHYCTNSGSSVPVPNSKSTQDDLPKVDFCGIDARFPKFGSQKECLRYIGNSYRFKQIILPIHPSMKYTRNKTKNDKKIVTVQDILEENEILPYGQWKKYFKK